MGPFLIPRKYLIILLGIHISKFISSAPNGALLFRNQTTVKQKQNKTTTTTTTKEKKRKRKRKKEKKRKKKKKKKNDYIINIPVPRFINQIVTRLLSKLFL